VRFNYKYLLGSVSIAMLLCLTQIIGNEYLIFFCLMMFMVLIGIACSKNFTLPLLMFFLPWTALLKIDVDSFSAYTFGLVLVCFVSVLKKRFSFKRYQIACGILIAFLTLLSKFIDGSWIAFDYIAFIMLIVLFPVVKEEYKAEKYEFFHIVVFFSAGIILAVLCAWWFSGFPNISKYITVYSYLSITRMCGFYGDPNFYSAQITAALGGCLYAVANEKARHRMVWLGIFLMVLIYCGFMSGSKSFVIVTFTMIFVWVIELFRTRGKTGRKTILILCSILFAIYVTSSALFSGWIDIVLTRFSFSKNLSDFTTGRTELWASYIMEIISDAKIMFLGKGFTNVKINGRTSHNTILQLIFQIGAIGSVVMLCWIYCFFIDAFRKSERNKETGGIWCVIVGCLLPWMAIDALFFDEFFLLQWFIFAALHQQNIYSSQHFQKGNDHKAFGRIEHKSRVRITWR